MSFLYVSSNSLTEFPASLTVLKGYVIPSAASNRVREI